MNRDIRVSNALFRFSIALFTFCLFSYTAFAQFETATVLGSVRDANEAAVQNATVVLKNIGTDIAQTTTTDENGDYQFVNVKIGNYQVIVEASGFNRTVADQVNVSVNARQRVDLTLQIATATETVVITDAANPLQTDSSEVGVVVQRRQVVALPLNGRSYANLVLLAPGVRESNTNSNIGGGREAAFNVNGLRATFNNFLLDGIDNNAYGTSNQSFSSQVVQVSPDAIAEFKVQTNAYSAEFGRSGGAVINASYKSGTNEFHGAAWEFHRNTVLNAVGFFKPVGGVKPPLIRNQFGFTFGGPIIKDRTFFFGDYEGFRQIQKNVQFSTVPTLAQRQGILNFAVRNPLNGVTYAAGTPIPLTPFAQKVLNELPAPNVSGLATVPGIQSNNYQELVLNRNFNDKYNVRVDHNFNDSFSIFGRWSYRKSNAFEAPNIPGPSGSNQNGLVDILNKQFVVGATQAYANASVLDVRLSHSIINAGKRPPLTGGQSVQELYGITGLPNDPGDQRRFDDANHRRIFPIRTPGDESAIPKSDEHRPARQLRFRARQTQFENRLRISRRQHGCPGHESAARTRHLQRTIQPSGKRGREQHLQSLRLFLRAAQPIRIGELTVAQMRQRFHFAYVQDDFKVNQKLTLNLGLRYEFGTPYYEANNRLSNYDPVTNSILLAKDGSLYDRALVDPDYNNFGPRLGFAYNVFDKTVIRGGYGLGYVYLNRLGSANILGTNFPFITRAAVAQNNLISSPLCVGNVYADNCFRTTQQGYPTSGLPNNVTLYMPREAPTSSIQNWQLSIQREIPFNFVVDVAYVGNKAKNLVILADYNQARPFTAAENALPNAQRPSLQARRPIPGFGSISAVLPEGFSEYNALQIKLERRFSQGFYLLNSFTWSKTLDNASQVLEEPNGNTGTPQNVYDIGNDRGIGAYDQPFNNTTSFVYELPFGRGRYFGDNLNPVLDSIFGGWILSGVNTMTSGQPINFRYGPSLVTNNLPSFLGGVALRPNVVCDPINREARPNPTTGYFVRSCLTTPTGDQPFGNAGRNIARSDNYFNFDLGVHKQFRLPINEETRLEFRAEFFNLFNRTNFQAANPDITSNAFGNITSTFPARQIQFALKFYF
jgi:hypothetical protein